MEGSLPLRPPPPQPGTAGSAALKVPRAAPLGASVFPKRGETPWGSLEQKGELSRAGLSEGQSPCCVWAHDTSRGVPQCQGRTQSRALSTQTQLIPLGNTFPSYPREPNCSISLRISAFSNHNPPLSFFPTPRCFHHLLAPLLHHSHPEHALRLQHPPGHVQCLHVAGLCQQRCQPDYLHHLQHRVPQGFHEDPPLLRATNSTRISLGTEGEEEATPFTRSGAAGEGLELLGRAPLSARAPRGDGASWEGLSPRWVTSGPVPRALFRATLTLRWRWKRRDRGALAGFSPAATRAGHGVATGPPGGSAGTTLTKDKATLPAWQQSQTGPLGAPCNSFAFTSS